MPKAAVVVALVIAFSLSVIAYVTLHRPPPAAIHSRLLSDVDPTRVDSVAVLAADGRASVFKSGREGVEWFLTSSVPADKFESEPWPANASRVRAAIRLLCELEVESPRDDVIPANATSTSVALSTSELGPKGTVLVRIAEGSVAGRTNVVRTGIGTASAESNFAQAFAMSDLSLWREPLVFSLAPQDWSRLEITGKDAAIVMSRVGRAWALQKPILAGADPAAVETSVKALSGAAIVRFVEKPAPDVVASLENPAAIITTEFERREQIGDTVHRCAIVQELRVGPPADVGGTTFLCRAFAWSRDLNTNATSTLWGPAVVVLEAAALTSLASDPASYVSRVSLRAPQADVFHVSISDLTEPGAAPRVYARATNGWRPAGEVTIATDEARNLQLLLTLLGEERAARVSLEPVQAWSATTRVAFKSSEGIVVQELSLGASRSAGDKSVTALVTFDGTVYRAYESKLVAGLTEWLVRSKK